MVRDWVCHKELTADHYACQQIGKQSKLGGEKQRFPSKSEQDFWRDPRLCWDYSLPGIFFFLVLGMPWCVIQILETETLISPDARSSHCGSFLPVDFLSGNCPHQRSPHFTQGHFASSGIRLSHLRSPCFKGVAHFWGPICVGIQRSGTFPPHLGQLERVISATESPAGLTEASGTTATKSILPFGQSWFLLFLHILF